MLKSNFVKYFLLFILLVLVQVSILNRITISNTVSFLYIYFILKLPFGTNRNLTTLLGFLLGLTIDIFCNTPGINAAATTLIAFFNQPIRSLFFIQDDYEGQTPSMGLLGGAFFKYAVLMTSIHSFALICLGSFSFNIKLMALRFVFSVILTSILIFALEGFSSKKKKAW